MDIYVSHSGADTKLAERLTRRLEKRGLSVWLDRERLTPGGNWQREVEEAIRSANNVLVLVGRQQEPDKAQQLSWRTALEAVWQDPEKRLIPVLRKGAEVPKFVLSGTSDTEVEAVRLDDARDLRDAVQAIVEVAKGQQAKGAAEGEHPVRISFSPDAEVERSERMSEIRQFALQLK